METSEQPAVAGQISAVVNTYNAAEHLDEVLNALRGFDETLVCDMESTDDTVAIATRHGARVVNFPKGNITIVEPARNFAIRAAKSEWVLVVDADEIVTPELHDFLYDYIKRPDCADALMLMRKNFIFNKFNAASYPDYIIRFMRRDKVLWPPTVHALPNIEGRVDKIDKHRQELALIHKNDSVGNRLRKMNVYTSTECERQRGRKSTSIWNMMLLPLFYFLKYYLLKGGILRGRMGLYSAVENADYRFYMLMKLWEEENKER